MAIEAQEIFSSTFPIGESLRSPGRLRPPPKSRWMRVSTDISGCVPFSAISIGKLRQPRGLSLLSQPSSAESVVPSPFHTTDLPSVSRATIRRTEIAVRFSPHLLSHRCTMSRLIVPWCAAAHDRNTDRRGPER